MLRRLTGLAVLVACAACGVDGSNDVASDSQEQRGGETLPLLEVSGLAGHDGRFVAVGDRSSKIVSFRLQDGKLRGVETHEPLTHAGTGGSQFEAIAFDGKGNVVVLAETGGVVVLDDRLEKERASTQLDWASANPLVDGHVEENSLGEGVVVLSRDHLLVALEKRPTALVEFGPKGSTPLGFSADARRADEFVPPNELVALKAWRIDDPELDDLSEITVGPDGALWGLSQQSKTIVRFERTLKTGEERASVKDHIDLPSKIAGAEGLAFDGSRPVVARDRSSESTNLFVLDPVR